MRHPKVRKRENLPAFFNELGFRVGAEIGVKQGNFSLYLCKGIPDLGLYCVDAWESYSDYVVDGNQEEQDQALKIAQEKLKGYRVKFIRKMSMDAVKDFADSSLDFVYIDANHEFDFVMEDIIEWSKKVRKGGIVSGHDYFHFPAGNGGVVYAVDAYALAHKIKQVYLTDDREHSWFFFKE